MKKYCFEYVNQRFTTQLALVLFLLFFVLLFGTLFVSIKISGTGPLIYGFCFLISVIVPFVIFRLNIKKVKKEGHAILHDSFFEFNLSNEERKIIYAEIKSYLIQ